MGLGFLGLWAFVCVLLTRVSMGQTQAFSRFVVSRDGKQSLHIDSISPSMYWVLEPSRHHSLHVIEPHPLPCHCHPSAANRATLAHSTKPRKKKKPTTPYISSDLKDRPQHAYMNCLSNHWFFTGSVIKTASSLRVFEMSGTSSSLILISFSSNWTTGSSLVLNSM